MAFVFFYSVHMPGIELGLSKILRLHAHTHTHTQCNRSDAQVGDASVKQPSRIHGRGVLKHRGSVTIAGIVLTLADFPSWRSVL